jgi:hypothetical protein
MLQRVIGFSHFPRALATALLVALGACNPIETGDTGQLEILPSRSAEAPCDAAVPGQLQLAALADESVIWVSGDELCKSAVLHRDLPAGLYSVSWQPSTGGIGRESDEAWALRGPSTVNVFPGQVTRLLIRQATSERVLASHTADAME